MLVEAYYNMEDYETLEKFANDAVGDSFAELLSDIAEKFVSVGLADAAVKCYMKLGDVKSAVECCVLLNEWDLAIDLAKRERFPQIEELLSKYAQHFLQNAQYQKMEAVQLY